MSKRKSNVKTMDIDVSKLSVNDTIVLEDGTLAKVTSIIPKEVEVKCVKTVTYLQYEASDRKGRKQLWYSVHMDDEEVEMVKKPRKLRDFLPKFPF